MRLIVAVKVDAPSSIPGIHERNAARFAVPNQLALSGFTNQRGPGRHRSNSHPHPLAPQVARGDTDDHQRSSRGRSRHLKSRRRSAIGGRASAGSIGYRGFAARLSRAVRDDSAVSARDISTCPAASGVSTSSATRERPALCDARSALCELPRTGVAGLAVSKLVSGITNAGEIAGRLYSSLPLPRRMQSGLPAMPSWPRHHARPAQFCRERRRPISRGGSPACI